MGSLLLGGISTFITIATASIAVFVGQYLSKTKPKTGWGHKSDDNHSARGSIERPPEKMSESLEAHHEERDEGEIEELKALKKLYHQLHSLEKYPEVLIKAKRLLVSLLKETSSVAQEIPGHESILSVQSFSRQNLEDFQRRRNNNIGKEWERYNIRRKAGGPRELFGDREEATWWLKQIAPVKYVDGAWLGHVGKVTAPFVLQKTIKGAWQILSEEMGDGDLGKNHVHLYHKLLETVAPGFPTPDIADFGHPRHQLDEVSVWKSAIAQLLVSLFPHEFLPEILGFNLHFEAISMDTLKAGMELKEVGLDPYYFILHISIDNAHSGHTAIAIDVVCEYMDQVLKTEGQEAAQIAWRKVQAGYLLSEGLPGTIVCPSRNRSRNNSDIRLNGMEAKVIEIFRAKAQVVNGIHCSSRVRIGSRSITDWLDPVALESKEWQMGLLNALSNSKYWICRGESRKSRFIRELQWNGRMFGSFTQDEYKALREWIDSLPNTCLTLETQDTSQPTDYEGDQEILSGNPVFLLLSGTNFSESLHSSHLTTLFSFGNLPLLEISDAPIIETFLPLWLSHPCLLQAFVSVPWRTKSDFACTILKILRAQGGFDIEQECVAGMGEVRRPNSLGLGGIGMNIMAQHELSIAKLPSLKHVLQAWPSKFSIHMLYISMRPIEHKGVLIGMATAFAKMHLGLSRSRIPLLTEQDGDALQKIARRELDGLELCWKLLELDGKAYSECCRGYVMAADEIKKCFQG